MKDIQESILKDLGCVEVTSRTQKKNGTSAWKIPTGEIIAEYKTGYCRNTNSGYTTYQLNKVVKTGEVQTYHWGTYEPTKRVLLPSRKERMNLLIQYTIRKLKKKHLIMTSGSIFEIIDPDTNLIKPEVL